MYLLPKAKAICCVGSIVTNCNQATRANHAKQFRKELFSNPTFSRIVAAITEGIIGFMRMQGEDVPQEDTGFDLRKNIPDNCRRLLRNRWAFCWSFARQSPSLEVHVKVHIVR